MVAAREFPEMLWDIIDEGTYSHDEDLMESGAQRKDQERREKAEVTEELKGFMMQEMARGCSLFVEALFLRRRMWTVCEEGSSCSESNPVLPCHLWWKKRATTQTSLDCFFNRVDRIESSKESEPVPLTAVWVMLLLALHLLLPITFSSTILHCLSLLQSVVPPVCSHEPAPVCYLLYCATALFNVPYCKIKNVFFLFSIF